MNMKTLADFSPRDIQLFEAMHKALEKYNAEVAKDTSKVLETPPYTEEQMTEYSSYRQLLMQQELNDNSDDL